MNIFISFTRRLHLLTRINISNQGKCYIRYAEENERIHVYFQYNIGVPNSYPKEIRLQRPSCEHLHTLCSKISEKIIGFTSKKLKKYSYLPSHISVQICDDSKTPMPSDMTCLNLVCHKTPLKLEINEKVFDIVNNTPWIINYKLPEQIFVGFVVYPLDIEITTKQMNRQLSKFNWYRGKDISKKGIKLDSRLIKWHFIENNFYYTPTLEDVGMRLKLECVPVDNTGEGPVSELLSNDVVKTTPNYFPFEKRHLSTSTKLCGDSFRCVSYNILADFCCNAKYGRAGMFPYCPTEALELFYRANLIRKEIFGYNADIMCLQEVDKKVYEEWFQPFLELYNDYDCLYYQEGKNFGFGLACFYRKNRFRLLEDRSILLAKVLQEEEYLLPIWNKIKNNELLTKTLLSRSTMGSATVLQSVDCPNEVFVVGNTHLYFHPDADDIRLIQGAIIIFWLRHLKDELKKKMPNMRLSIIVCGDFNSLPEDGVYKFYTTGTASDTLPDWKSNVNETITGLNLKHDVQLDSACGTPEFTNFTNEFVACIDYIYYERNNLKVTQVVPFPSKEEVTEHTALPSVVFPSDHIALVADFKMKA